jgi:hypothetical protein
LPTGANVNDVVVHDGLSGAQPESLFGILYHQTNATTGKSLGSNQVSKLIPYTALEQEHQWEQLGVTNDQGRSGCASDLDLFFTGEKTMAGVPIKTSINASFTPSLDSRCGTSRLAAARSSTTWQFRPGTNRRRTNVRTKQRATLNRGRPKTKRLLDAP